MDSDWTQRALKTRLCFGSNKDLESLKIKEVLRIKTRPIKLKKKEVFQIGPRILGF